MSEDLAQPFLAAATGLIRDRLPFTTVHISGVKGSDDDLSYPYIVVWPIPPSRSPVNLAGTLIAGDCRLQLVGVALDPFGVTTVLDRAGAALVGQRPLIPGWRCGFIREIPVNQPTTENPQALTDGRSTYRSWSQFRMTAEPAPSFSS